MKDGSKEKMMPLFWLHWLHWLHAPILVSIGQSKLKLLSGNWISIFSNSDLDLNHRHLGSNPKLPFDISYPYNKFGVNRPNQTKVIEWKPKVDARPLARPPAFDFSITITRFSLKTWLKMRKRIGRQQQTSVVFCLHYNVVTCSVLF